VTDGKWLTVRVQADLDNVGGACGGFGREGHYCVFFRGAVVRLCVVV
jgi:hypothetical protein